MRFLATDLPAVGGLAASLVLSFILVACGGGGGGASSAATASPAPASSAGASASSLAGSSAASTSAQSSRASGASSAMPAKSAKRGIAYDLASAADMGALSAGVSWWYNWSPQPNAALAADARSRYAMDFIPMLWNGSFDADAVEGFLKANPQVKYMLVMNEPNLVDQSRLTPAQAAAVWPAYEALAARAGVKIVGPALTWGTMPDFADPVVWLDAFYAAYRAANAGRDPRIDYLAFHWYDYGLAGQLDRLAKYGKSFWVTEFANWHNGDGAAQIDSVAKQKAQMQAMVAILEARADVFRYAWFTGRLSADSHYTSLLGADGELTELGQYYLALP